MSSLAKILNDPRIEGMLPGRRVHIDMTFSADLDALPGTFYNEQDWIDVVNETLLRSGYNPEVVIHKTDVTINGKTTREILKEMLGKNENDANAIVPATLEDYKAALDLATSILFKNVDMRPEGNPYEEELIALTSVMVGNGSPHVMKVIKEANEKFENEDGEE